MSDKMVTTKLTVEALDMLRLLKAHMRKSNRRIRTMSDVVIELGRRKENRILDEEFANDNK